MFREREVEKVNTVLEKVPRVSFFSKKKVDFFRKKTLLAVIRTNQPIFFWGKKQYFLNTFQMCEYR